MVARKTVGIARMSTITVETMATLAELPNASENDSRPVDDSVTSR